MQQDAFARKHQEWKDAFYWANGPCCAGCDHWACDMGKIGECTAAPPVSGDQVLKSLGIRSATIEAAPGQPFTEPSHVCGAFQDNFDWCSLDAEYLERIGARFPDSPAR
ncbi:hypothetical protein J2792_002307 [Novosphingobium capsulatum]|uniref:Uncharacterized protein n=2 Tax=Novosphingobium capsulatum TaxID=13688 RepID=A0ABU1MM75_9SPHN|nr:hypothetical protein [Novosphingobium capsulatum]